MTTKLDNESTYFLPFNRGNGVGINSGKGNPLNDDGFGVSYMWEDILTKDTILELLSKFVFVDRVEKEDPITGAKKKSENIIFPRYHQLDCLRAALGDVVENHTSQNYLIQHSAGSGKTYTISWLAHRLASQHDNDNKIIFDNIIIVTDRVVVDRQLQRAVTSLEHKSGLIKVMDEKCTSDDLRRALEGNTKIIATTIQKFLYIADIARGLQDKTFAVIIDEAHSSTAGKDMAALTKTLSSNDDTGLDMEDIISEEILSHGKQKNVSIFAFTATPKPTTLQLFGRLNNKGLYEAFHLYSMKQAIEEGFILDVLQHFIPYKTFYTINKAIQDDPKYKNNAAKKQIARVAMLDDVNINQRIEIIIEHFRNTVMHELDGQAKAMVITGSRPEAVKYYNAFLRYVERKGYSDIHPLVAFSGKVTDKQLGQDGDKEYSEAWELNRIIGLRRSDLKRVRVSNVHMRNNRMEIKVDKCKGGKTNIQVIYSKDQQDKILDYIKERGLAGNDLLFTRDMFSKNVDFQATRRLAAQTCYKDVVRAMQEDPAMREYYQNDIKRIFRESNKPLRENLDSPIYLRGAKREQALANGTDVKFDRTAAMVVSLYLLSHFRTNVTIDNYLT